MTKTLFRLESVYILFTLSLESGGEPKGRERLLRFGDSEG